MEALFLVKNGKSDLAFEKRAIQVENPNEGEVQITVESFGINYADVMARNGLYRETPDLPCVLGYEVMGTITKVGQSVDQNLMGKKVVAFTRFGGYSKIVNANLSALAVIDHARPKEALALATQYVTAYYMAFYCNGIHPNDNVLIHASAGGVGTALIQLAKLKGARVFGTASSKTKLDYIKSQGADYAINYLENDYSEIIQKQLGEQKLDATFNPIAGSTFKKDLSLLNAGGKLFLYGGSERSGKKWGLFSTLNFVRKMGRMIPIGLMMTSKSVLGVNMLKIGDHKPEVLATCLREVVKLWQEEKIKPQIASEFNAKDIAEAHSFMENRKSIGKIIVSW